MVSTRLMKDLVVNGNKSVVQFRYFLTHRSRSLQHFLRLASVAFGFLLITSSVWAQGSPIISSISPTVGPPSPVGSSVTIHGSNFGSPQGNSSVTFAG